MRLKSRKLWRSIGTIVSKDDQEKFYTIARSSGITPSAYLRSMIVDVLAEDADKAARRYTVYDPNIILQTKQN